MAGSDSGTILKVLNGLQSGVEVSLIDGEYTLGSSDDDDIKLLDVSLKPGHARIAISPGKIEIAGVAGALKTRNGVKIEAGGTLQEIEPLDVVTGGTTRFALGSRTANWASIADIDADASPLRGAETSRLGRVQAPSAGSSRGGRWRAVVPIIALLMLVGGGFAVGMFVDADRLGSTGDAVEDELATIEDSISTYDFADRLKIHQEVDGLIYVNGFVDTAVERRAVVSAIHETNIPARIRVAVLELIRNEIVNLIETEGVKVDFELSDEGELELSGVILAPEQAEDFSRLMEESIVGLAAFRSDIQTSETILSEVERLAERAQIAPLVLLRLEDELIEATGVLPSRRIDAWVGFLQAYASDFSEIIPLRSLVQLENPDGVKTEAPAGALYLGERSPADGDFPLDVERLHVGDFELADVFVGQDRGADLPEGESSEEDQQSGDAQDGNLSGLRPSGSPRLDIRKLFSSRIAQPDADTSQGSHQGPENQQGPRVVGDGQFWTPDISSHGQLLPDGEVARRRPAAAELTDMAGALIDRWQDGQLDDTGDSLMLKQGMDALNSRTRGGNSSGENIIERYEPLLARMPPARLTSRQCWPGSTVTEGTIVGTLFWLDLLSVSTEFSVTDLDPDFQLAILEAAFNPLWNAACAESAVGESIGSIYLHEISRNPDFIRYLTRDLSEFSIDVAGASVAGERYIQTRSGQRMVEGSAPDESSRLTFVGQLGVAVERDTGYSTVIYDANLNWLIR